MTHIGLDHISNPDRIGATLPSASGSVIRTVFKGIKLTFGSVFGTALLILKDCRGALLSTSISMSKTFEMLYVEPYQPSQHSERSEPEDY